MPQVRRPQGRHGYHRRPEEGLRELGIHAEPLRLRKARGPPIQQDLPSASKWDGIDPVYPD